MERKVRILGKGSVVYYSMSQCTLCPYSLNHRPRMKPQKRLSPINNAHDIYTCAIYDLRTDGTIEHIKIANFATFTVSDCLLTHPKRRLSQRRSEKPDT